MFKKILFFISLLVVVFVGGCSEQNDSVKDGKLKLVEFGPTEVLAGRDFNLQPNGVSAIWSKAENLKPQTVLVLNGVELNSNVNWNAGAVSALVPKELYSKPGSYSLYLLDKESNTKSNELTLTVK